MHWNLLSHSNRYINIVILMKFDFEFNLNYKWKQIQMQTNGLKCMKSNGKRWPLSKAS